MRSRHTLQGLLVLISVLLLLNLVALLARPEGAPAGLLPQAQAGTVLKLEGSQLVTTNQDGSIITLWELGRYVGDGYQSVKVRSFDSSGNRVK
ncbi:MAG: hypothetical protein PWP23_955 [Candidatus Sumerlaeota bacterium]|nr:hypothetical protein [Candidatus Sumerlaeota bacterium]